MAKKGQVTIWVIIAIVIVSIVLLFLFLREKNPFPEPTKGVNPVPFIQTCARQAVYENLEKIMAQGGFINPTNYKLYKNTKIAYLCENEGYFKPCINQHPMFLNEVENELLNATYEKIDECFYNLKSELEKHNTQMNFKEINVSIAFAPQRIKLSIYRETEISERGENKKFRDFSVDITHPIYDLIMVANEIASQEAKYCYFEYVGYMMEYPNFDIRKESLSDSTKIYIIKERISGKSLSIAIRGCAIPPGL